MQRYVFTFGVTYLILTAITAFLLSGEKLGGFGINLAITMAASCFAASRFVNAEGRTPTKEEKSSYTWGSLIASFLVSALLVITISGYMFSEKQLWALKTLLLSGTYLVQITIGLLLIGTIHYVVIRWAFSWYSNKAVG